MKDKFKIRIVKGKIPESVEVYNSTGGYLAINPDEQTINIFRNLKKELNKVTHVEINESLEKRNNRALES